MPHEVIMPALGMAQDAGLLVAWRKAPGDPVKSDDILMEVETDKSTMEVEAGFDGYVTELRIAEGDEARVGAVIAVISDSPEDAKAAPAASGGEAKAPEPSDAAPAPAEGREVIMPALGMAQDSGVLVAWHKSPGDPVKADDILMEVETDKSTMEVEAGFDGYVAELRIAEGDEARVGEVIAVISDSPEAARSAPAPARKAAPAAADAGAGTSPPPASASPSAPAEARPAPAHLPAAGGRILASPLARRLAHERGIDLQALVRQGLPQPFHAADLDKLKPEAAAPAAAAAETAHLSAEIEAAPLEDFLAWAAADAGATLLPAALWASFAAGALRAAAGDPGAPLHVEAARPGAGGTAPALYADPDRTPLSALARAEAEAAPALRVRDLSATRLSAARLPGDAAAPALTVARAGEGRLRLDLDFAPGALDPEAAIALLDDLARRAEAPLRHLL